MTHEPLKELDDLDQGIKILQREKLEAFLVTTFSVIVRSKHVVRQFL